MIVVLTCPGHDYTSKGLRQWPFENGPTVRARDYRWLFISEQLPRATYVFADIDRLYGWERGLAAEMFRAMVAAGLVCLNDPARVLTRYPLLRALARDGLNPFDVYRAEDAPRPRRFPVFLRNDADHDRPRDTLFRTQAALDRALRRALERGVPLVDLLVVEFVDLADARGHYSKFGTYRFGGDLHYDHVNVSAGWIAKLHKGSEHLWTEEMFAEDRRAVLANDNPQAVHRAFAAACIDWGRADWGVRADGAVVVFEINTNPNVVLREAAPKSFFEETRLIGRQRMARLIAEIDSPPGGRVPIAPGDLIEAYRRGLPADGGPPRRP